MQGAFQLSNVSQLLGSGCALLAGTPEKSYCEFSTFHQEIHALICSIIASNSWVRWCLPCSSTVKLLFYLLKVVNVLWGDTLRLCKYPVSNQNFWPPILASIDNIFLEPIITVIVAKWCLINSLIPSTFTSKNCPVRKCFSSFLIYSFSPFFMLGWLMDSYSMYYHSFNYCYILYNYCYIFTM